MFNSGLGANFMQLVCKECSMNFNVDVVRMHKTIYENMIYYIHHDDNEDNYMNT